MKIIHLTEAMGGGIVTFTDSISRRQVEEGVEVEVWYLVRPDTPSEESLRNRFDNRVKLVRLGAANQLGLFFRTVRKAYRDNRADVFHLHAAKGGAVGRLALVGVRTHSRVFYSPHGFPFLRANSSLFVRNAYQIVEKSLSGIGTGLILTSESERRLAQKLLRGKTNHLLKSGVPSESIRSDAREPRSDRPVVVGTASRIIFQKAPWRFAAVASAIGQSPGVEFLWIGDGDAELREKWIDGAPVSVTGWVSHVEFETLMESIDVFLFPSLWEGMALSLIHAQARGIPAVVSNAVGNVDSVLDGETGFICSNDTELIDATRRLTDDRNLRRSMSARALLWAREGLTDDEIGRDSIKLYQSE
ncbi:glycosyltransferase [Subtercola frigoramans]|uniref:D-inositol 3-phosphate glycosyltransferase n=1 Tax=Subtercola frigoramans TaxID=120298 RepID=A0ABS2L8K0_9MICO|nr:glycosyltransferase [Subtercola frigoramans]MBM7473428.1 glycosyltransferase involved in cell wall biosynthesis [Subtercola frigoramans]